MDIGGIGSIISGIGSLGGAIGGIFGQGVSASAQESINATNLKIAQDQMAFQEKMSSTAHQREVKDLVAAGLNPVLSVTGGSGASSPAGSLASMVNPYAGMPSNMNAAGQLVSQAGTALSQIKLATSQANQAESQAMLNKANTAKSISDQKNIDVDTYLKSLEADLKKANNQQDLALDGRMYRSANQLLGAIGNVMRFGFGGLGINSASRVPKYAYEYERS